MNLFRQRSVNDKRSFAICITNTSEAVHFVKRSSPTWWAISLFKAWNWKSTNGSWKGWRKSRTEAHQYSADWRLISAKRLWNRVRLAMFKTAKSTRKAKVKSWERSKPEVWENLKLKSIKEKEEAENLKCFDYSTAISVACTCFESAKAKIGNGASSQEEKKVLMIRLKIALNVIKKNCFRYESGGSFKHAHGTTILRQNHPRHSSWL